MASTRFVYRDYDGKFYSDNATVTINVAAVNDGPAALDDYYSVDHDTTLVIDAAAWRARQTTRTLMGTYWRRLSSSNPANGTVSLSADGSFTYTPNAGFSGIDTFTYVASDSLLDSRIASVNIEVVAPTDQVLCRRYGCRRNLCIRCRWHAGRQLQFANRQQGFPGCRLQQRRLDRLCC